MKTFVYNIYTNVFYITYIRMFTYSYLHIHIYRIIYTDSYILIFIYTCTLVFILTRGSGACQWAEQLAMGRVKMRVHCFLENSFIYSRAVQYTVIRIAVVRMDRFQTWKPQSKYLTVSPPGFPNTIFISFFPIGGD